MLDLDQYHLETKVLLTPNQRLARRLIATSCQNKFQKKEQFLTEIYIQSANDFINNLYDLATECNYFPNNLYTLDSLQREVVFKNLIKQYNSSGLGDSDNDPPLTVSMTKKIIQAWNLVNEWQLDWQQWQYYPQIEAKIFHYLANAYCQYLITHNFCDPGSKIDRLLELEANLSKLIVAKQLDLYGFDDFSPKITKFLDQLKNLGIKINIIDQPALVNHQSIPACEVYAAHNQDQEYYAVAWWAKQQLAHSKNIGIIVPNLATHRKNLIKVFEDVIPDRQLWNISGGEAINQIPVIKVSLILLNLIINQVINFEDLSYILRSNYYLKHGTHEISKTHSIVDILLSDFFYNGYQQVRLSLLIEKLWSVNLPLAAALQDSMQFLGIDACDHENEKKLLPSQWLKIFWQCLIKLGWPAGISDETQLNGININSTEYQAINQFQGFLRQLIKLDAILGSTKASVVFKELTSALQNTAFQIQTDKNQIDILGMLEGAGINYDKLWLFNLTSDVWPESPEPNPFIPITIQREHQLPHATVEREFEYAKKLTMRYLSSASSIIVSYSKYEQDRENTLSPLLQSYVCSSDTDITEQFKKLLTFSNQALSFDTSLIEKCVEIEDRLAPKITKTHIKSGVKALSLQALCPFRAFAETRLQAVAKYKLNIGPAAWLRGQIIHQILEYIFTEYNNKAKLTSFCNAQDYLHKLSQYTTAALQKFSVFYPNIFTLGITYIEKEHLLRLIDNWLQVELARNDFTVVALEQKFLLKFDGLEFNVRVDRIDQVPEVDTEQHKILIIDYKTTRQNVNSLFADNISDLQLPLYSFIDKLKQVDAVLFGHLLDENSSYDGVANFDSAIDGAIAVADWNVLTSKWREDINILANNFKNGNAEVSPVSTTVCHNCHLPSFCRKDDI